MEDQKFVLDAYKKHYGVKDKVYQVREIEGLGLQESPFSYSLQPYIYHSKEKAKQKADDLWKSTTSEEERSSGWCYIHYDVLEIEIQDYEDS